MKCPRIIWISLVVCGVAGVFAEDLNATNGFPLLAAADRGDTNTIKVLLSQGEKVDQANRFGATALMCAAMHGYVVSSRLLLDKGADINAVTRDGRTALILAVLNGSVKEVQLLLERKADPKMMDESGKMAVDYANAGKHADIMAVFKKLSPTK